jgi:hypothetical protein
VFQRRTLKVLAVLVAACVLLSLPAYLGPSVLQELSGRLVLMVFLTPHLFHSLGVPGLLEHGGHCGWGWCAPSALGWVLMAVVWLAVAWLAAWGLARLGRKPRA